MDAYASLAAAIKTIDPAKIRYDDPNDHSLKSLCFMYKHKTFSSIKDVIKEKLAEIDAHLHELRDRLSDEKVSPKKGGPSKPTDTRKKKKDTDYYNPDVDYGADVRLFDIEKDPTTGLFIIKTRKQT